jgi:hypothetical protein
MVDIPARRYKLFDLVAGALAQLVEQQTENLRVPSSILGGATFCRSGSERRLRGDEVGEKPDEYGRSKPLVVSTSAVDKTVPHRSLWALRQI